MADWLEAWEEEGKKGERPLTRAEILRSTGMDDEDLARAENYHADRSDAALRKRFEKIIGRTGTNEQTKGR